MQPALEADRKAIVRLMCHLRQTDRDRTVIMVQVQNESRRSGAALALSCRHRLHGLLEPWLGSKRTDAAMIEPFAARYCL